MAILVGEIRSAMGGEKLMLEAARLSDKDAKRLRKQGDALPHAIHANPALKEAKKRGISLAETGHVKPIAPICPTAEEIAAEIEAMKCP